MTKLKELYGPSEIAALKSLDHFYDESLEPAELNRRNRDQVLVNT